MAKADRTDAYKQLPATTRDELAAAVTLRHPLDGGRRGFIPRTRLFGSTAAALHYNCLSRIIASPTCRTLKIPRIGYYDDLGIISPECLIKDALGVFASFNKALSVISKALTTGALPEFRCWSSASGSTGAQF